MHRLTRALVPALLLAGCLSDDTTPADTAGADTSPDTREDTTADTSPADTTPDVAADTTQPDTAPDTVAPDTTAGDTTPAGAFSVSLGSWTMQPAEETTRCVVKRLGNRDVIRVSQMHTRLAPGSHHLIVYKSSDTVEQTTPFPCTPFAETLGGDTVPLMISQIREETLTLPDGVAFELAANQMIRLEAHYLNYFPTPIETGAEVTFELAPESATELADFMFYGTTQIYIPAGRSVTTPWKFHPVPSGVKVFGLTGHTHALGTNVEIEQSTGRNASGLSVYPPEGQPFEWAEAPLASFAPPLEFNGEGFRFRCSWTNPLNHDVTFGESANQEMCFFWAYYYPSQGFLIRF